MRRALIGVMVLGAAIALAGCGGGTSSATVAPATSAVNPNPQTSPAVEPIPTGSGGTGQTGAGDAAALLTADMAASVIGGSPTKVDVPAQPGGAMSLASYTTPSGDDVTILVERLPGLSGSMALQAAIAQQGAAGDMQPIGGLGDTAGKVVSDHDATIAFVKGDTIVVLAASAAGSAGTDLEPKLESIAKQIAGSL